MGLQLPCKFDGRVLEHLFLTKKPDEQASAPGEQSGLIRRKLQNLLEV